MGLDEDLKSEIYTIFKDSWNSRNGQKVPKPEEIALTGNDGVQLEATVLYADMVESTSLVESEKSHFAAEIYKAFLVGACRIIREHDGYITAFDGDRVMAVYIGQYKNTNAAKSALKIKA